jgi:tetratricopeptide (TPR) repeat protein
VLMGRAQHDPLAVAWHARRGGEARLAAQALVDAADVAYDRADVHEAEHLLDEALVLEDSAAARLRRARVRMVRGDLDGAGEDAARALGLDAGPEALERAGWIAYYRRDFAAARRYADEGARRATAPDLAASCLALAGRVRHSAGDIAEADVRLSEALSRSPATGHGVAGAWLAWLRVHQGRPVEAMELVDFSLLDPHRLEHPFAHYQLLMARAYALGLQGRSDEALVAVEQLGRLIEAREQLYQRYRPMVANFRAWVLRQTGRTSEADEWNERAVAWSDRLAFGEPRGQALLDLADSRIDAGRLDQAWSLLAEAAQLHGGPVTMGWHQRQRALLLAARAHLVAGQALGAVGAATEAVEDSSSRGARRHELMARALLARARALAGDPIDLAEVDGILGALDSVAAFEVWWLTADVAAATGVERWQQDAERRLARVVAGAGNRRDEVAAWGRARLGALRTGR